MNVKLTFQQNFIKPETDIHDCNQKFKAEKVGPKKPSIFSKSNVRLQIINVYIQCINVHKKNSAETQATMQSDS